MAFKNLRVVPQLIFGRGGLAQLGDVLRPHRPGPAIFLTWSTIKPCRPRYHQSRPSRACIRSYSLRSMPTLIAEPTPIGRATGGQRRAGSAIVTPPRRPTAGPMNHAASTPRLA